MTDHRDDADLDALFAQARAEPSVPDVALLGRIINDAVQTDLGRRPVGAAPVSAQGWLAGLVGMIGGWPALGGLVAATAAGFWFGLAPPASLTAVAGTLWGETVSVSLDPQSDLFGLEG